VRGSQENDALEEGAAQQHLTGRALPQTSFLDAAVAATLAGSEVSRSENHQRTGADVATCGGGLLGLEAAISAELSVDNAAVTCGTSVEAAVNAELGVDRTVDTCGPDHKPPPRRDKKSGGFGRFAAGAGPPKGSIQPGGGDVQPGEGDTEFIEKLPARGPQENDALEEGAAQRCLTGRALPQTSLLDAAVAATLGGSEGSSPENHERTGADVSCGGGLLGLEAVINAELGVGTDTCGTSIEAAVNAELGVDRTVDSRGPGREPPSCRDKTSGSLGRFAAGAGLPQGCIHFGGGDVQPEEGSAEFIEALHARTRKTLERLYSPEEAVAALFLEVLYQVSDTMGVSVDLLRRFGGISEWLVEMRVGAARRRIDAAVVARDLVELRLALATAKDALLPPEELVEARSLLGALEAAAAAPAVAAKAAPDKAEAAAACAAIAAAVAAGDTHAVKEAVAHAKSLGVPKREIARAHALGQEK